MFTGECGLDGPIERKGRQGEREGNKKRGEGGRKEENVGTEISSNLSIPSLSLSYSLLLIPLLPL